MLRSYLKFRFPIFVTLVISGALYLVSCSKPNLGASADSQEIHSSAISSSSLLESGSIGSLQAITLAGNGGQGLTNGQGTAASFNNPTAIAIDKSGNQYVADRSNHVIRKISPFGAVTTLAGSGTAGVATGTGTAAQFNNPSGVAVDASGNIYVADRLNHAIRKISPAGVVSNFAGIPNPAGPGSTDGPASSAKFNNPTGVALDTAGNVYVADAGNNKIRKITPAGFVSTLAGSGTRGGGNGPGSFAQFNAPWGVAVTASGIVFVADSGNHKIRKITGTSISTSSVSTLAGGSTNGATPGFLDGTGTAALFSSPTGITIDTSGNLWVADKNNHAIRQVTSAGVVTTFSGNGIAGFADGAASEAKFSSPSGIAVDTEGNLFVADQGNQRIREIGVLVIVSTLAGNGTQGHTDGQGISASFLFPEGIALDASGNAYVADRSNNRIRKITPQGVVSTYAGGTSGFADGPAASAAFLGPSGVAVDGSGNVYVSDASNNRIRKISTSGIVSTLAGSGTAGFVNGPANIAQFWAPSGLAVDAAGNVFVADHNNNAIRKITPEGVVSRVTSQSFAAPTGVALDNSGNLYITESGSYFNNIRKISPEGVVSTIGSGTFPNGIALDAAGNVYVADWHSIRRITPAGVNTVIAGTWSQGFLDGPGKFALFNYPFGIAVNTGGTTLYVVDNGNNRIRKIQ